MSFFRLAARTAVATRQSWLTIPACKQTYPHARYSSGAGLSRDAIQTRVFDVLKGFENVDPAKLTASASFSKDLGLDSLSTVEIVLAVEEEFSIFIPDTEADEIQTVQQAIDYIAKTPEAH